MPSVLESPARFATALAAALLLLALAACDSKSKATPANFILGINAHFADHPDCLFPNPAFPDPPAFPFETTDPAKTKQLNALADAQLLNVQVERDIHASRYTTTEVGARVAPRFCYGHRVVTSVDSFTPPAQANGFPETQVTYHYTLQDVPVWAKSDAMRSAFPALALDTAGGGASGTSTLAGTMAGWQVPD
jgi:hypothetical protein